MTRCNFGNSHGEATVRNLKCDHTPNIREVPGENIRSLCAMVHSGTRYGTLWYTVVIVLMLDVWDH